MSARCWPSSRRHRVAPSPPLRPRPQRRPPPQAVTDAAARDRATPTARKVAEQHNVNLARVSPSGEAGRVVKQDVQSFLAQAQPLALPADAPAATAARPRP